MKIKPLEHGVSEFISYHHVLWQFSTLAPLSAVTSVTFGGEEHQPQGCLAAHTVRCGIQ